MTHESPGPALAVEQADVYAVQGSVSTTVEKIILKHGDAFLVADAGGDLPQSEQETGLYWQGTRFLRTCDAFLNGLPLISLSHSVSDEEGACQIDLTNPFMRLGTEAVYQGTVHLRRVLQIRDNELSERLILTSFHPIPITVKLGLKAGADFRDILEVRGIERDRRGTLHPPRIGRDRLALAYDGLDGIRRLTTLTFDPPADLAVAHGLFWDVTLQPNTPVVLHVVVTLSAEAEPGAPKLTAPHRDDLPHGAAMPVVASNNVFFNRMLTRGMHDLEMMCARTPYGLYPYGGIPWYVCPFGRDALITSLEFLPWFPQVARGTLTFLAAYQGTKTDPFTEEEPGRILHEYRMGEMANLRELPFIPYYGSVDATPLFLVLLEQYVRWTEDFAFLEKHWPNAEAAARWMLDYGDADGDGLLEYARTSEKGLINQGWKDSWNSVMHEDGRLARAPIALCEAQGYAYAAYRAMEYLAGRLGKPAEAPRWAGAAERLRARFLESFWWPEEEVFYLALDGLKRPCKVVSSNAGQCLWSGIVPDDWAQAMVERLLQPDMYTEWGIRTLSDRAVRYNPMSYHNGSVWPHDTALVGAGFARYGRRYEAGELLGNLFGASLHYDGARLPELFCGFTRAGGFGPTRYPVACAPQSWAAGAPFLLLSAILGFEPDARQGRLTLRAPTLPAWMDSLELRHLRLGTRDLHMRFERAGGATSVILTNASEIEVHVLPK